MSPWQHFRHEADIGVRGVGKSIAGAFAQAAIALTAVITDPRRVNPKQAVPIAASAANPELLFVDWLNALIFEMTTRRMLFARFEVKIREGKLLATAWGEAIDPERHAPAVEPKGATYTDLAVRRRDDGNWLAQCVVDV